MEKVKKSINNLKSYYGIDCILVGVLLVWCFLAYQHADITHTAGSGIAYLNGHILDFYDYNVQYLGGNGYMPTTYILYAIWDIPLRLFGIVKLPTMHVCAFARMWYKVFTTLLYFGVAWLIYKMCQLREMDKKSAALASFIFITNPIAWYSQFMFGQYDIITLFFMMLGIYYWMKGQEYKFAFAFSVALTCKYFALLFFIPLLLLREKRILEIIKKVVCVCALFAIEVLIYLPSEAFREGVFGFGATNYIFELQLDLGHTQISIVVLTWISLCAYAFFKEISDPEEEFKWAIYLCNIATFITFGLSFWHPQWLLLGTAFWTLGTISQKRVDVWLLLDMLLYAFYILVIFKGFGVAVSENLFHGGVFGTALGERVSVNFTLTDYVPDTELGFTCFASILFVTTLFKHPKMSEKISQIELSKWTGFMRFRYLVCILIYVIPTIICLCINFFGDQILYDGRGNVYTPAQELENYYTMEQHITGVEGELKQVSFYMANYERTNNDCIIYLEVVDEATDEVIGGHVFKGTEVGNNRTHRIHLDAPVTLSADQKYSIRVHTEGVNADSTNTVLLHQNGTTPTQENYATLNGVKTGYNFAMVLLGDLH